MKKILEKFLLFSNKKYGITPDILTYIRIFSAPWLALIISKILSGKSLALAIITILIYIKIIAMGFYREILAHAVSKTESHDRPQEDTLSQISEKILIIFMLIPFGLNLFTFLIILAESVLAFQIIYSPTHEKQANRAEKIKMILQTLLIPILILRAVTNFIPEMTVYGYIIITIIFTYIPIYENYFYFEK
jgi:hypothetical protein